MVMRKTKIKGMFNNPNINPGDDLDFPNKPPMGVSRGNLKGLPPPLLDGFINFLPSCIMATAAEIYSLITGIKAKAGNFWRGAAWHPVLTLPLLPFLMELSNL